MRVALLMALALLSACASDKLALAPPPGVDFSGHWRLNVEESDDPLHLMQSQNVDPSKAVANSPGQGGRGGRGSRDAGGFPNGTSFTGPTPPTVGALSEAFRWPGRDIAIKQVAGVLAVTSAGVNEVYQPTTDGQPHHHGKPSAEDDFRGRDMPARDRGRPPTCGWDDKTLVVQSGEADDDHPPFDKRYSLSEDGQQLIEVVGFKGGRSDGFTISRTWDKVDSDMSPAAGR